MKPYWQSDCGRYVLYCGDCLEILPGLAGVDAVVTDPPYGLSFMGKKWDYDVPSEAIWQECLRVLKPGGHLLVFAGTRTQHRMAVRIEDAGFEIRDMIAWVYGSGFPKSLDVSKAIDKAAGVEREVVGARNYSAPDIRGNSSNGRGISGQSSKESDRLSVAITAPATDDACQWAGWGTALKPALEPITLARKPLVGTVAENVLAHGTGALNVDGCRVPTDWDTDPTRRGWQGVAVTEEHVCYGDGLSGVKNKSDLGRWPANVVHDGSEEVLEAFAVAGEKRASCGGGNRRNGTAGYSGLPGDDGGRSEQYYDTGTAARFFYCAKASKAERGEGNTHPTVKPLALMEWLVKLICPSDDVCLDPFLGTGTTALACIKTGRRFIGIERERSYLDIAVKRIQSAIDQTALFNDVDPQLKQGQLVEC